MLRANLGTAFGNIAVTYTGLFSQKFFSVLGVKRVHFELRYFYQHTRTEEFILFIVVSENMAHVLAQVTFDAFPKFLASFHVLLIHCPFGIFCGREGRYFLSGLIVPGNIRHEVLDYWEGFYRIDGYGLIERQAVHTGFTCKCGHAVHLGAA